MRKWALLAGAISTEVAGTLSLRASQDHSAWLAVVVAGYLTSFIMLTLVLRAGVPVGVAYGIWGALGTAVTAVLAAILFGDPFTWPIVAGIGLIIAGVLLIEFGSHRATAAELEPDVAARGGFVMWLALSGAILVEVLATLSLRASDGFRKKAWIVPIVVGYLLSFYLLWVSLGLGMPVGIAYGVWSACGVALVAVVARFLFKEPLTPMMALGIALIVGGVLTIEMVGVAH